jgi:hypothetical protein
MTAENRKQRLRRLDIVFVRSPIYFVTASMQDRRKLLATPAIHETFLRFGQEGPCAWGMDGRVRDYARSFASFCRNGCRKSHTAGLDEVVEEYDLKDAAVKRSRSATLAENIFRSLAPQ